MRILQRKIFLESLKIFTLALSFLTIFFILTRMLQMKEMLIEVNLGFLATIRLFIYLAPWGLVLITPIAAMLAVLFTFLRMGTDRELIIIKASGISPYQLLPAPIAIGILTTLLNLVFSLYLQSLGMMAFRAEILNIAENETEIALQAGIFNSDIPNMLFFARRMDTDSETLEDIFVEDKRSPNTRLTILAPQGTLGSDFERGDLVFFLKNGHVYSQINDSITVMQFSEYALRISLESLFSGLSLGGLAPAELSWKQLMDINLKELTKTRPSAANDIQVERHTRIVFPFICFLLSLFAMPMALSLQGVHKRIGLAVTLSVFTIYFALFIFGTGLARKGTISPWLGLWGPSFLFLFFSFFGVYLLAKERLPQFHKLFQIKNLFRAKRKEKRGKV